MESRLSPEVVSDLLAGGMSEEGIYTELISRGHTVGEIQAAFAGIDGRAEGEDTQRRTIRIVLTAGAVLVAAGVFSFIAANWGGMPRPVKVATIIAAMLAVDAGAWHLRERTRLARTGDALLLLGSLMYGAGIFLVAQMFHVRANWPDGFILWMIGVIAMGFAAGAPRLFQLAFWIGAVALAGYPMGIFGELDGYNPFLLTSPFLLLVATLVLLASGAAIRRRMPVELRRLL
ncbi:MAG: DUF2157 domain-containing protein [bacterium]|nr:DUF2157 domain-containing protein [bacterium]